MLRPKIERGATIDGFLIGELIHQGGMALLWEVTRPDISIPLLMKVPNLMEGEDPAAIVGFEMEQMILPRLAGSHVPRFIANGDFSLQPYIVMEHIGGETLLNRLKELPLGYEDVTMIGARIAAALDDLHRQHVIHLDLKPSNIMMRPTGEAVLIDFGLSRHDQLPDLMQEEFRLPYGSAPYMAPEQVLGCRSEPRSDLFSFGVLLYFFSTGVHPFGDPDRLKRLKRRLWRDPVPPRRLKADFPPWFQEIILRCLEIDPACRYPTAAQLAFDLNHPSKVMLSHRATKLDCDPLLMVLRRRFNSDMIYPRPARPLQDHIASAPIIAVAIDLEDHSSALSDALRLTTARILNTLPGARVACLNVLEQSRLTLDTTLDEEGRNKHVQRLVELRHWAEPLKVLSNAITFHVLEAPSAAAAILDYAGTNSIDHIVMGARANSIMRALLGSVSGEVAAHAHCTVTVVRPPRGPPVKTYDSAELREELDARGTKPVIQSQQQETTVQL